MLQQITQTLTSYILTDFFFFFEKLIHFLVLSCDVYYRLENIFVVWFEPKIINILIILNNYMMNTFIYKNKPQIGKYLLFLSHFDFNGKIDLNFSIYQKIKWESVWFEKRSHLEIVNNWSIISQRLVGGPEWKRKQLNWSTLVNDWSVDWREKKRWREICFFFLVSHRVFSKFLTKD